MTCKVSMSGTSTPSMSITGFENVHRSAFDVRPEVLLGLATPVAGGYDATVRWWDALSGEPIGEPLTAETPEAAVGEELNLDLAFSPDGRLLAAGDTDGAVHLVDLATREILGEPLRHRAIVRDLAFDRAGDMLVAALIDGTVVLWDSATGRRIGDPLEAHDPEASYGVPAVVFSPDGAWLLTAGDDGSVLRWDMDPDAWKSAACRVVGRELRPGERLAYMGDQEASPVCP